jgi:hypothetical protein
MLWGMENVAMDVGEKATMDSVDAMADMGVVSMEILGVDMEIGSTNSTLQCSRVSLKMTKYQEGTQLTQ